MSDEQPPTRPRPRPRPVEPFRELATPPEGTPRPLLRERPIETLADLGRELRIVRRELVLLRSALPPPPPLPVTVEALPSSVPPPPRPSRPARVAAVTWKGTQWLGVVTLALTIAAQVAALLKPGLVGPIERARDAVETLAK